MGVAAIMELKNRFKSEGGSVTRSTYLKKIVRLLFGLKRREKWDYAKVLDDVPRGSEGDQRAQPSELSEVD